MYANFLSFIPARWTINELSSEIQLQPSVLRRKITFWQNHGVLNEEENDVFVLMEDQKTANRDSLVVMIEEEEESVTASSQDMKEEELQVSFFKNFKQLIKFVLNLLEFFYNKELFLNLPQKKYKKL